MPVPTKRPPPGGGIEYYFKRKGFLTRAKGCILAPLWAEFIEAMRKWGHAEYGIYTTLRHSFLFSEFAAKEEVRKHSLLTDVLADRYLSSVNGKHHTVQEYRCSLHHLMAFLRERGDIPPAPDPPIEPVPPLLKEYKEFLARHRNVKEPTIRQHQEHLVALFETLGSPSRSVDVMDLDAEAIFRFVTHRAKTLSRSQRKSMCAALRSFLRFLYLRGYIVRDIASSVPVIPSFKLDRLPRAIDLRSIEKILHAVDRTTSVGRRDYAILLILATYGLRQGQLCALRLEHIDWRRETIRVPSAKNGREFLLPLQGDVAEALIDYLRHGRPDYPFRELFLRVRPPIGPLAGNLFNIIRTYARKAGIKDIPTGAHAWRHGCASRMLTCGESLKTIRDVLGHQSIETTFVYTKIDIVQLRQAALEWPEVLS